jgi:hypothetical protein
MKNVRAIHRAVVRGLKELRTTGQWAFHATRCLSWSGNRGHYRFKTGPRGGAVDLIVEDLAERLTTRGEFNFDPCLHCGATFNRQRVSQKYCSPPCQNYAGVLRWRKERNMLGKKALARWKKRKTPANT